ncbi:MAG: MauE/DoxX family redox-associated membrane protein [Pseudomonadota bacterium]
MSPVSLFVVQLAIAIALAALFLSAAYHKLHDRLRFQAQLAEYELLPSALVPAVTGLLATVEIVVGLSLLTPPAWLVSAPLAAGLLLTYAAAIAINLLRGRTHIDCGCGDAPQLLSGWLILRNLALTGGALALLSGSATVGTTPWFSYLVAVALGGLLALTYSALTQLLENASVLQEWRAPHG